MQSFAFEKIFFNAELASRPMLLLGVLLIIVGVQLLSFGLLADLLARTYHESQGKRTYTVRNRIESKGYQPAPGLGSSQEEDFSGEPGLSDPSDHPVSESSNYHMKKESVLLLHAHTHTHTHVLKSAITDGV